MSTGDVVRTWTGETSGDVAMKHSRVCRSLFGPVDHDLSRELIKEELQKQREWDRQRWNFDFEKEMPLDGRYEWSQMDPLVSCPPQTEDEEHQNGGDAEKSASSDARREEDVQNQGGRGGDQTNGSSRQTQITDFLRERKPPTKRKPSSTESVTSPLKTLRRSST